MFLQSKKKKEAQSEKKPKEGEADLNARLEKDLAIHNMPSKTVLNGSSYSGDIKGKSSGGAGKHKKVGLIIIIAGLLFVVAIIYFAYTFLIKPVAQDPVVEPSPVRTPSPAIESPSVPEPIAPVVPSNIIEANVEFATTTEVATSSDIGNIVFQGEENVATSSSPLISDTDEDGLNDVEEAILGSDPLSLDSDEDGFADLLEIKAGYNPIGADLLADNPNLAKYSVAKYEILYPKLWTLKPLATDETVIFTASDDSFVQLSVQANREKRAIEDWYRDEFVLTEIPIEQLINTKAGAGIASDDGLTVYFTDSQNEFIYILLYTPLDSQRLAYPEIFNLMRDSLVIKK